MIEKKHNVPFDFILEHLASKVVIIKPMFGCFGLYIDNKIYFFLRDRNDQTETALPALRLCPSTRLFRDWHLSERHLHGPTPQQ